ncbi:hypothetical protein [uncultured Croceitalea sp.]|uniref:hypothetical protein n=1 Tax=uncultured Croceitalea sp. TaxID=1798908 RepID=UPI0033064C72
MRKIILVICFLSLLCCKKGKRENQTISPQIEQFKQAKLELIIEVIVQQDDVFELYYYEQGEKTFSSQNFVYNRINGKNEVQEITFVIPVGIYPERLRIDLGKNNEQEEMFFNGAKLIFGKKEYVFSKEEINEQFKPSKFMLFDPITRSIKTQSINNRYDPYFYTMKVNSIVDYLMED